MDKLRVFDRADRVRLLQQHGRFVGTILGECPLDAYQQRRNLLLTSLQFLFALPPFLLLALLLRRLSLLLEPFLGFEFGALPGLQFLPLALGFLTGTFFLLGNRDSQLGECRSDDRVTGRIAFEQCDRCVSISVCQKLAGRLDPLRG